MKYTIKKYANRKLHLEGTVKYLTMLDLSDLAAKITFQIQDRHLGEDKDVLQVICDRTGRDLTLETLSRALYERLKRYCDEDQYVETKRDKPAPFAAKSLMALIAMVPSSKKPG